MFTTDKTVGTLKTIAMVAALAVTMWSLGLPYLQLATAASIANFSDTLSTSAPSVSADHTIAFDATSGVVNGGTVAVTFGAGFDLTPIDETDIAVSGGTYGDFTLAADCSASDDMSASTSGQTLTLTLCAGDGGVIDLAEDIIINIGETATTGAAQIVNPAIGTYDINITSGADTGETKVVILSEVTVTASVDTVFTFGVAGVGGGLVVNGATTTGATTNVAIPFGELSALAPTTTAQDLTVTTNASNGYSVTVQIDGPLESAGGAIIDGFVDGSDTNTPATWIEPDGSFGVETSYGHWGVTSDDQDAGRGVDFATSTFIAASTSPRIVMGHTGPADGNAPGIGAARVGYQIEITSLQEAGSNYSAVLTYVATPTF